MNTDLLFFGGSILTMDSSIYDAQAVLIRDGKIHAVGSKDDLEAIARPDCQSINLNGRVLLPAMIDTHTHFYNVVRLKFDVDLDSAQSLEEVEEILIDWRDRQERLPVWIGGSGWDKNVYPSLEGFDYTFLDRIFPDVPVTIKSKDLHSLWCNSLALKTAGIHKDSPDPPGGKLGRFPNGHLNGFLYEKAWKLIESVRPPYEHDLMLNAANETIREMWKLGLSGVHFMDSRRAARLFRGCVDHGFHFRFFWHFPYAIADEMIEKGVRSYTGDERFKICGQKLFFDGSIGSQTARMFHPYPDGGRGVYIVEPDELDELVAKGARHGIASSIHAIGDEAVHRVIQTINRVRNDYGDLFHRIEHLQCIRPEDVPALKESKAYCAMQPIHIKMDAGTTDRYWGDAAKYSYRFRTLIDEGVPIGFGSDAPVESINPFLCIYSALQRKFRNDPANPSWYPEERITVMEALRAFTIDAAKGSCSEKMLGSITPGKLADLIVLDDFTMQPDEFWLEARSRMTIIDGEIVYRDKDVM